MASSDPYIRRRKQPGTIAIIRRADQVEIGLVVHRTTANEDGGHRFSWTAQVGDRLLAERSYMLEAVADVIAADVAVLEAK